MSTISKDQVVLFKYTLRNDDGIVIDSSNDEAFFYLHGHDNIVPGLEKEMEGKAIGDAFKVAVPPAEGYGERLEMETQKIPLEEIGAAAADFEEGMPVQAETEEGIITLWVKAVSETHVEFDLNHPLAGETLHFEVEIAGIREANAEELEHGHPHGPDGTSGHDH